MQWFCSCIGVKSQTVDLKLTSGTDWIGKSESHVLVWINLVGEEVVNENILWKQFFSEIASSYETWAEFPKRIMSLSWL